MTAMVDAFVQCAHLKLKLQLADWHFIKRIIYNLKCEVHLRCFRKKVNIFCIDVPILIVFHFDARIEFFIANIIIWVVCVWVCVSKSEQKKIKGNIRWVSAISVSVDYRKWTVWFHGRARARWLCFGAYRHNKQLFFCVWFLLLQFWLNPC